MEHYINEAVKHYRRDNFQNSEEYEKERERLVEIDRKRAKERAEAKAKLRVAKANARAKWIQHNPDRLGDLDKIIRESAVEHLNKGKWAGTLAIADGKKTEFYDKEGNVKKELTPEAATETELLKEDNAELKKENEELNLIIEGRSQMINEQAKTIEILSKENEKLKAKIDKMTNIKGLGSAMAEEPALKKLADPEIFREAENQYKSFKSQGIKKEQDKWWRVVISLTHKTGTFHKPMTAKEAEDLNLPDSIVKELKRLGY